MLSSTSRWLTHLTSILDAVLGILLSFLAAPLAPVFAWKVTPFMTMTMGIPILFVLLREGTGLRHA